MLGQSSKGDWLFAFRGWISNDDGEKGNSGDGFSA